MKKILNLAASAVAILITVITLSSGVSKTERSGGGDRDLVEQLYNQEVKKNASLKEIEELREDFYKKKTDALEKYNSFVNYNTHYYSDARYEANKIQDATTKQRAIDLVNKSEADYKSKMVEWDATIAALNANEKELNDLHHLLKITVTIPVIQNYQDTQSPSNADAKQVNGEVLKIIAKIKAITK